MQVPFCAFNGGNDVFVDIGNKSLGLHALKKFIGAESSEVRSCKLARASIYACMHIGSCLSRWQLMLTASKGAGLHVVSCTQTLHVGDRFTASGNDNATRDCCAILWVAAPEETYFFCDMLIEDIDTLSQHLYIE